MRAKGQENQQETGDEGVRPALWRSLRATSIAAAVLAIAAVLGYPGVALALSALALLATALGVLIALVLLRWRRAQVRVAQIGIWIVVGAISVGIARSYADAAEPRRDRVVEALAAYHAAHERYPDSLEELAPAFIESVPVAVSTPLGERSFRYRAYEGTFILFYTPVFVSTYIYHPETGWRMRD